jgi:hypothetical protein
MNMTVAVTVFFVLPATLDGRNVQITESCQLRFMTSDAKDEEHSLTPGSVPNTWRMYMPHLVHFMLSVGSKDNASMPENAGRSENIAIATTTD